MSASAKAICLGEMLIDFVPTVTGTTLIEAPAFKKAPGGAPANVAVGLRRLGVESAFMGKLGDDPFGHFLVQTLADADVDTDLIRFSKDARTALAFVSLRADGEREFSFYRHPSADMLFEPGEVDEVAIAAARLLHYGTISLISEPSRSATLRAIEIAAEHEVLISCDPNLRAALWPDEEAARAGMRLGIDHAQILKISDDEVRFLTGSDEPVAAKAKLWHDGLVLMVVTAGSGGCTYFTKDHQGEVPSFKVEAQDATGAGDGFMAGLLQGVMQDSDILLDQDRLHDLCRFANAVGAITAMARGAIPSLPTKSKVESFLASQAR